MEKRIFGNTGGLVSSLGFGGAEIGFSASDQAIVDQLLNSALDQGLNVIDTAECYNVSEVSIGNAVAHRRAEYLLFTKVGHSSGLEGDDWDPQMMRRSIERSLQRLKTDCVDLVQLHSCSADALRQGDVIALLREARDAGKTKWIGYSGDGQDALYAIECGAFDTLQTSVNIADQECLSLTLPRAIDRGMGVIAKRPIANAIWKAEPPVGAYSRPYWERLQSLNYPFLSEASDEIAAVALRFTLAQTVHTAIVGTTRPERFARNAEVAAQGPLDAEAVKSIRARWAEVATDDWVGQT